MDLKELLKAIPHQWRVQSYSKQKAQATCVAYIDARDVMALLDEVCGPENWQSDYKDVGGQMFAGIGIKLTDGWVWKWDTGSESNVEAEKGQASDSFKRAAVKWGIGRFLYDLEVAYVKTDGPLTDTHKFPYVVDDAGNRVWDLTAHITGKSDRKVEAKPVAPKKIADAQAAKKKLIAELLLKSATDPLAPLETKEQFEEQCRIATGLELVEANYDEIISILER